MILCGPTVNFFERKYINGHVNFFRAAMNDEIEKVLYGFKMQLEYKQFTRPSDQSLVEELVESLVKKFSSHWKEETERQESMSVRAREILLRWGEFSTEYVKEARLLKQENEESGWMWWSLVKARGFVDRWTDELRCCRLC